jgi:protein-S-isoprenylcysteine O-methyltransferase Ste14
LIVLILWSWALAFHSRSLVTYALLVTALFYVRVVVFEEPWLARTHGDAWAQYRARVPRCVGVRRS